MSNDITWEQHYDAVAQATNRLQVEVYGLEAQVHRMERVVAEARAIAGLRSGAWPHLAQALADLDSEELMIDPPFDHPECGCVRTLEMVRLLPSCPVHGAGTDYWNLMMAERARVFAEMGYR